MKKIALLLLSVILVLLTGCTSVQHEQDPSFDEKQFLAAPVDNTMESIEVSGVKVTFTENIEDGDASRSYYDEAGQLIAQTFAPYNVEDYLYDYDNDGLKELISNCIYFGDGHCEAYIFKMIDGAPFMGSVQWKANELEDLRDWGANAVYTEYDPTTNEFWLTYSTNSDDEDNASKTIRCEKMIVFEPFVPEF